MPAETQLDINGKPSIEMEGVSVACFMKEKSEYT